MTTLDAQAGIYTLINTFTVEPENAERLLDELTRATREQFAGFPGFISANLNLAEDRRHVANYAQWRSKEDYDAATQDDDVKTHMAQAARIATSFAPIFYALRETVET